MAVRTNELTAQPGRRREHISETTTDNPDQIRHEIERTRAEMGQTIDKIQERLSPARLKQEAQESLREATIGKVEKMTNRAEYEARSLRRKIVHTVKENPVPAALIGVGVGWLIMSDSDDRYAQDVDRAYYDRNYYASDPERYTERQYMTHRAETTGDARERVQEAADRARDRASTAVDEAQDRVSDAAESVQESASAVGRQVQETAHEAQHRAQETAAHVRTQAQIGLRRTKRTFWATMNENPLAVGATALAVGALVGLALPSTPTENRLMGERRDELVHEATERARETAQETARKVRTVATEAKDAAVETAKEEADKEGLRPRNQQKEEADREGLHATPSKR